MVRTAVSGKTDYLVVGDTSDIPDRKKLVKAAEIIEKGGKLQKITEAEYVAMIEKSPCFMRVKRDAETNVSALLTKWYLESRCQLSFNSAFNAFCRTAEKLMPSRSDIVFSQAGIVSVFLTALLS